LQPYQRGKQIALADAQPFSPWGAWSWPQPSLTSTGRGPLSRLILYGP
jgi:hypothetical protein